MAVLLIMSVSGILNLVMGVIVILSGREKVSGLPFAFFSVTTFFWAVSNLFIHTTDYAVFVRLSYSLGALLPTFLLVWIYRYKSGDKQAGKSALIYATGLVFAVLPFAENLVVDNIRNVPMAGLVSDSG